MANASSHRVNGFGDTLGFVDLAQGLECARIVMANDDDPVIAADAPIQFKRPSQIPYGVVRCRAVTDQNFADAPTGVGNTIDVPQLLEGLQHLLMELESFVDLALVA